MGGCSSNEPGDGSYGGINAPATGRPDIAPSHPTMCTGDPPNLSKLRCHSFSQNRSKPQKLATTADNRMKTNRTSNCQGFTSDPKRPQDDLGHEP